MNAKHLERYGVFHKPQHKVTLEDAKEAIKTLHRFDEQGGDVDALVEEFFPEAKQPGQAQQQQQQPPSNANPPAGHQEPTPGEAMAAVQEAIGPHTD